MSLDTLSYFVAHYTQKRWLY